MSKSAAGTRELALFPLGLVLLPTMIIPLGVFEPRYQRLLQDVRRTDDRFGVVLIQQGSEVGETHHNFDSARARIGTVARILKADTATATTTMSRGIQPDWTNFWQPHERVWKSLDNYWNNADTQWGRYRRTKQIPASPPSNSRLPLRCNHMISKSYWRPRTAKIDSSFSAR